MKIIRKIGVYVLGGIVGLIGFIGAYVFLVGGANGLLLTMGIILLASFIWCCYSLLAIREHKRLLVALSVPGVVVLLALLYVLGWPYRMAFLESIIGDTPSNKAIQYVDVKHPGIKQARVRQITWWDSCCEPRIVSPVDADSAQVAIEATDAGKQHIYYVEVIDNVPEEDRLDAFGEVVRTWIVVDESIDTPVTDVPTQLGP